MKRILLYIIVGLLGAGIVAGGIITIVSLSKKHATEETEEVVVVDEPEDEESGEAEAEPEEEEPEEEEPEDEEEEEEEEEEETEEEEEATVVTYKNEDGETALPEMPIG